jgi:hypothetical protein
MSDLSTQATTINDALADPAPAMSPAPDPVVTLIVGLDGKVNATVRELNGEDEEFLASYENKSGVSYGDYLTAVLSRSVLTLGGEPVDASKLENLINGDRDILFLETMKATYGLERTINVICPHCGQKNDVVLDLKEDFPIVYPDFPVNKPIEVKGRKSTYRFNLPTGRITNRAAMESKSDAEANTIIIAECAVFDELAPGDRVAWAKGLNLADRRKIVEALLSIQLGPKLEAVDTHCAACEEVMPIALNWVSLLLS